MLTMPGDRRVSSYIYCSNQQVKKLSFGSSRSAVHPLYQWQLKFKGLLISKFSLYFHDTLSKQAPPTEVKAVMAKASIDFLGK